MNEWELYEAEEIPYKFYTSLDGIKEIEKR